MGDIDELFLICGICFALAFTKYFTFQSQSRCCSTQLCTAWAAEFHSSWPFLRHSTNSFSSYIFSGAISFRSSSLFPSTFPSWKSGFGHFKKEDLDLDLPCHRTAYLVLGSKIEMIKQLLRKLILCLPFYPSCPCLYSSWWCTDPLTSSSHHSQIHWRSQVFLKRKEEIPHSGVHLKS